MQWSHYQLDLFNAISKNRENILVEAGPGCSKTSSLVEASNKIKGGRTIITSFSKLIANELAERVGFGVESSTLNALAFGIVREHIRGVRVDKFKEWNILRKLVDQETFVKTRFNVDRIVGLLKNNLILENVEEAVREIIVRYAMDVEDSIVPLVIDVYQRSLKDKVNISFDDQKLLVATEGWNIRKYTTMMVDESQDLSALDMRLVELCSERKIFVGDRYQGIFLFRGAMNDAMNILKERFDCKTFDLPICYRCPESVIELAREINPKLESPVPNLRGKGIVETINKDVFRSLIQGREDMVLCRTVAPLIKECLKNLAEKPCYVKGREIGDGLIRLVEMVSNGSNASIDTFDVQLDSYYNEQAGRLRSLGRDYALSELEDKVESIKALEERVDNVNGLLNLIRSVIVDDGNGIAFMTMHKSKGLENKNIYILRKDLLPHKKARTDEQLQQERNLEFVTITRSQYSLRTVLKEPGEK